jgi:hypothetical protein
LEDVAAQHFLDSHSTQARHKVRCMWRCLPTVNPVKAVPPFSFSNNWLHSCLQTVDCRKVWGKQPTGTEHGSTHCSVWNSNKCPANTATKSEKYKQETKYGCVQRRLPAANPWQDLHDDDKTCMQLSYWELVLAGEWTITQMLDYWRVMCFTGYRLNWNSWIWIPFPVDLDCTLLCSQVDRTRYSSIASGNNCIVQLCKFVSLHLKWALWIHPVYS